MITASLPPFLTAERIRKLLPAGPEIRLVGWDLDTPPTDGVDPAELDVVVPPFHTTSTRINPGYRGIDSFAKALPTAVRTRLVQLLSIGHEGVADHVPTGAVLANARGVMEQQTAEHAVTLLLSSARGIPRFRDARSWQNLRMPGLYGKRVVLLGFGGIGELIAGMLAPFGAEVVAIARTGREVAGGRRIRPMSALGDLSKGADALVCAIPLTEDTRTLVDSDVLAGLADGAIVVNVGRGPVIDTTALIAELRTGRVMAGLDVTDPEPLPDDHELWQLPNALITPHVGGHTDRMYSELDRLVAGQIGRVAAGEEPVNVVAGQWQQDGQRQQELGARTADG